jgi:NAD-dependent dihydropyrimidine dehydrogenase PreA subunit
MPKTTRNIPREKIPWFPAVDSGLCTGCRVCVEYCAYGVYVLDEEKNVAVVRQPYKCIVGCSGCRDKCAAGAIAFPDLEEFSALLRKLRQSAG